MYEAPVSIGDVNYGLVGDEIAIIEQTAAVQHKGYALGVDEPEEVM